MSFGDFHRQTLEDINGMEEEKTKQPEASTSKVTRTSAGTTEKPRRKRTAASYAGSFFIKLGVTAVILFVLLHFVAAVRVSHTNASYPMIKDGDLCIAYRPAKLAEGDAVIYRQGDDEDFGRIIATAGRTVDIKDGVVTVDGSVVYQDSVYPTETAEGTIAYPYTVPEGCVFILHDYRTDTSDSREVGAVDADDCIGKVIFIMRKRDI